MAKKRRIPTPLSQHWNHFRTGALPLIAFIACVWVTMSLWERRANQGTIVAEAEHIAIDVASGADGRLISLRRDWQLWDEVGKDEIVAQLDDSLLIAEIEVVRGETDRIKASLESTLARTRVDVVALGQEYNRDRFDRAFQAAQYEVQLRQVEVNLITGEMEIRRIRKQLEILKNAGRGAAEREKVDLDNQIKVLISQYVKNKELKYEVEKQIELAKKYIEAYSGDLEMPQITSMQEDLQKALEAQDAQIELINLKIQNMTIRAPVAGVISLIHKRPGEAVVQGEPVITIESDTAQYVIGYWREKHRDRPYAGTPVTIRLPQPNSVEYDCQVAEVGPQYAPVPQHQLRDFGMPEYGLPVKIEIPDELKATIRPGELVHVIYRGDAAKRD